MFVNPIFQTPLLFGELSGISDKLMLEDFILKCMRDEHSEFKFSKSIQTGNIFDKKEITYLIEEIQRHVNAFSFDIMRYQEKYCAEISSLWGNLQPPGSYLYNHMHYNSVFSGVFYVNENDDFPETTFIRGDVASLSPDVKDYTPFSQGSFSCRMKKDTLVIFPSWLRHEVPINKTDIDRFSMSFNVILRGNYYNVII